mmetsp:Transcript_59855/g.177396  ORF Transcript_59855/g.177396 Transcript_59855/m.177396 type:complete len:91 (-) Transcript_59855:89-361(-)
MIHEMLPYHALCLSKMWISPFIVRHCCGEKKRLNARLIGSISVADRSSILRDNSSSTVYNPDSLFAQRLVLVIVVEQRWKMDCCGRFLQQ